MSPSGAWGVIMGAADGPPAFGCGESGKPPPVGGGPPGGVGVGVGIPGCIGAECTKPGAFCNTPGFVFGSCVTRTLSALAVLLVMAALTGHCHAPFVGGHLPGYWNLPSRQPFGAQSSRRIRRPSRPPMVFGRNGQLFKSDLFIVRLRLGGLDTFLQGCN